ncbi:hypothetical protein [Sphingobium sp.]|uniref:hypothetical protein n=1 Tax=Sphingobium sp. TaxID=1912891 RepID=UPI002612C4E5|nr:hypothetical protein [Sphingobium sp.]
MKTMRVAATALLCFVAFWGAAHIGLMPGLRTDDAVTSYSRITPGADAPRQLWRYLPVIR